ncbi:MAG: polyketide synthase dehydratase domain-containing protein [Myxococcota bacterium]
MPPAPALPSVFDPAPPEHPSPAAPDLRSLVEQLASEHEASMRGFAELHRQFLAMQEATSLPRLFAGLATGAPAPGRGAEFLIDDALVGPSGRASPRALIALIPGGPWAGLELTFTGAPPPAGATVAVELSRISEDHATGAMRASGVEILRVDRASRTPGLVPSPAAAPALLAAPAHSAAPRSYTAEALKRYAMGDLYGIFGDGFRRIATHSRTPQIADVGALRLGAVEDFDPERGQLTAEVQSDGDLASLLDGGLQAMAFFLSAAGLTIPRDGYRFEPLQGQTFAIEQLEPASGWLSLRLEATSLTVDPVPVLIADLVWSAKDRVVARARGVGLALATDWPLAAWRRGPYQEPGDFGPRPALSGLQGYIERSRAEVPDGLDLHYPELLASALGPPRDAFGPSYERLSGPRRVPRLPGPPFLFVTRAQLHHVNSGGLGFAESEYRVPPRTGWYFDAGRDVRLPFAVLLELILQPAGLVSLFRSGWERVYDANVFFRNLDGTGTIFAEVEPSELVRSHAKLLSVSTVGALDLFSHRFETWVGDRLVARMESMFGQFLEDDLASQAGLPTTPAQVARAMAPPKLELNLRTRPARYFDGALALTRTELFLLDRVIELDQAGGAAGLGYARAELDVDPRSWVFKAHFFSDPVQPGSIGLQSVLHLIELFAIESVLGREIQNPRFESPMIGQPVRWKYRGQVVPENKKVLIEIEVRERSETHLVVDAWLWVDRMCVYSAQGFGVRVVRGRPAEDLLLDPEREPWMKEHCPDWVTPSIPIVIMGDLMAGAASERLGRTVTGIVDLTARRWLTVAEPTRAKVELGALEGDRVRATLLVWRRAKTEDLSRFEVVAEATILFSAPEPVAALPPLRGAPLPDPYQTAHIFHGPPFQTVVSGQFGPEGASGLLDVSRSKVPSRAFPAALLDAAFHVIRVDQPWRFWPSVPRRCCSVPREVTLLRIHGSLDDSVKTARIESRVEGATDDSVTLYAQLIAEDRVLVEARFVLALLPWVFHAPSPLETRNFLRDRQYVEGAGLSRFDAGCTELTREVLADAQWIKGSLERAYDFDPPPADQLLRVVAVLEHAGQRLRVHPSAVRIELGDGQGAAWLRSDPATKLAIRFKESERGVVVEDG